MSDFPKQYEGLDTVEDGLCDKSRRENTINKKFEVIY